MLSIGADGITVGAGAYGLFEGMELDRKFLNFL